MKKTLLCASVALTLLLAAGAVSAAPRVVAGELFEDDSTALMTPAVTMDVAALGGGGSGYASFDDLNPCFYSATVPVTRAWYNHRGVSFRGPNTRDGAAILHECSSFGVTGYSEPNFLAFNCNAVGSMANGGTPIGPETLTLTEPVLAVQLSVGSGTDMGQTVRATAKNAAGRTVATATVSLTEAMQPVFLMGASPIKKVIIDVPTESSACVFVVDDVYFGTP